MTHSEMGDAYDLYVLGILDPAEAAEISEHISQSCEHCMAQIKAASSTIEILAQMAERKQPPAELRDKVLALAQASRRRRGVWPLAFTLAAAASLMLLLWGISERGSLKTVHKQLDEVSRQRNELRSVIAVLSEADTRTIQFGNAPDSPHGRVFISRNGGVVFVGGSLPPLVIGRTFELWLVPTKGNPQPAGLFRPNAQGISVNVLDRAINASDFAAVAVSIEPDGGSPQPSTKPILVIPVG